MYESLEVHCLRLRLWLTGYVGRASVEPFVRARHEGGGFSLSMPGQSVERGVTSLSVIISTRFGVSLVDWMMPMLK